MCYCSNTGVEQTLNKSQHTKLTLEKIFYCACWDSNSQPFDHESDALQTSYSSSLQYSHLKNHTLKLNQWQKTTL